MTESRFSFLTLPLALYLFGYVVWLGDRVTLHALALATPVGSGSGHGGGSGSPVPEAARPYLAPRCAAICKRRAIAPMNGALAAISGRVPACSMPAATASAGCGGSRAARYR